MQNSMNSALDLNVICDVLNEIECYLYSEELRNMNWFSYYEELFIDIAFGAAELHSKIAGLRNQTPALYDNKEYDFNIAAMLLNYDYMDYLIAADSCSSEDAGMYEEKTQESFAICSKQEQRQLIISVFEVMVEFQQLKAAYKTLLMLLEGFDHHNSSDMEVFLQGGHAE